MFRNIAVPLDGSDLAARALPYAKRLAGREGHLHLVRAPEILLEPLNPDDIREAKPVREAEAYLRALVHLLAEQDISADIHVLPRAPETALYHVTSEHLVDTIVMSTHGWSGLKHLMLGSVAEAILRRCATPVLLISPHCLRDWDSNPGATIIVPLDGSKLAEEAIAPAGQLAAALQATVTLVHVIEPPRPELYTGTLQFPAGHLPLDTMAQDARMSLDRLAGSLKLAQKPAVIVRFGQPAMSIPKIANEQNAAAIVMATHGYTGFARMLMGSVGCGVVQRSEVPVLLVKPAAIHAATEATKQPEHAKVRVTIGLAEGDMDLVREGLELILARQYGADGDNRRINELLDRLAEADRTAHQKVGRAAPVLRG